MRMYFKLIEALITQPKTISLDIADKIYWYHFIPMTAVRIELGFSITASLHSGYRPRWWELKKKRSGGSQHVFRDKGAVDWTCFKFKMNKDALLMSIIKHTEYTRIAIYNGFLHCDYKQTNSGKREIYTSNSKSEWTIMQILG